MADKQVKPLQVTGEERLEIAERKSTCPFIASAVASGTLDIFANLDEPLASVEAVIRLGDSGNGDLGSRVLGLFARGNHCRYLKPTHKKGELVPADFFNLLFGGSQGAHAGHSGILLGDPDQIDQGRLDMQAFDRLAATAREGFLSIDGVGDFIADNIKRDPATGDHDWRDVFGDVARLVSSLKEIVLNQDAKDKREAAEALTRLLGENKLIGSAGEWGLLFALLKNSPNASRGDIAMEEVRLMFVEKRFPPGWEDWEKRASDWLKATTRLTVDAARALIFD